MIIPGNYVLDKILLGWSSPLFISSWLRSAHSLMTVRYGGGARRFREPGQFARACTDLDAESTMKKPTQTRPIKLGVPFVPINSYDARITRAIIVEIIAPDEDIRSYKDLIWRARYTSEFTTSCNSIMLLRCRDV